MVRIMHFVSNRPGFVNLSLSNITIGLWQSNARDAESEAALRTSPGTICSCSSVSFHFAFAFSYLGAIQRFSGR